jgi:hypothetical protein
MKEIDILSGTKHAIIKNKKHVMRVVIQPQPEKKEFSTKLTNMEDGKVGALFTDVHTHPADGQAVFPDVKQGDILFFDNEGEKVYIQVTSVHPERLHDMNEQKAIEEGFEADDNLCALDKFITTWQFVFDNTEDNPWV